MPDRQSFALSPQAGPPMSTADIYANARALGSFLREKSDEIEAARTLPPEVAERMCEAGLFRIAMPKIWGGPELGTHRDQRSNRGDLARECIRWMVHRDRRRFGILLIVSRGCGRAQTLSAPRYGDGRVDHPGARGSALQAATASVGNSRSPPGSNTLTS